MRRLSLVAAGALVAASIAISPPAFPHDPSGGADCETGAWAAGRSYDEADTNTLTVSVSGGQSKAATFDRDGYLQVDIPQDGRPHDWSWSVDTTNQNPAYDAAGHGTITCGELPPPPPPPPSHHLKAWFRVVAYCNAVHVEGRRHVASIAHTRFGHRGHRFVAHATPGATFANGHTVQVKRAWKKRSCGDGS